jgi:hypothetical protein
MMKTKDMLKWSKGDTCYVFEDEDNLHDHLKIIWLTDSSLLFFRAC